jgi:cytidine deaminase
MIDADLLQAAWAVRERAYAPYSKFAVGAVLLDRKGKLYAGCNVENLSYGLTMCAERVAIGRWVADQGSTIVKIVVVADTQQPISPCGACRQVMAEFAPQASLLLATRERSEAYSLAELFPRAATGILDRA